MFWASLRFTFGLKSIRVGFFPARPAPESRLVRAIQKRIEETVFVRYEKAFFNSWENANYVVKETDCL